MRRRRTFFLVAMVVAVAAGLAAGLVLTRSSAGAKAHAGLVARGAFHSAGWGTEGAASIVREPSGKLVLHFTRAFHTQHAPDLWVYVGRYQGMHGVGHWQMAGPLYRWWGRHTFPLKAMPHPGDSVIIYCGKCDRAFGYAPLRLGV